MEYLKHPFSIGLGVGLILMVVVWVNALFKRRGLVREVKTLREHLHRQMEITQKGSESVQKELAELKLQNENLRVTNATLKQKPGRTELQTLVVYDKALRMIQGQVPGFAPAWENVLKEAEKEMEATERGFLPLLRKAFRPSLKSGGSASPAELEAETEPLKRELPGSTRAGGETDEDRP